VITKDRIILDGYARFELARLQGRPTLPCIEYELTESEALQRLLKQHRRSDGLNAFSRILLALDLEPWLKEKARLNQSIGGQSKGSSKLTEDKRLDVRREIAAAAGVSVGNVTKVKQLTANARPQLLDALRSSEISIHRAWLWSEEPPDKQLAALRRFRDHRTSNKIKRLISRHRPKSPVVLIDPSGVFRRLADLDYNDVNAVSVTVVKGSRKAVYLTEDLLQTLAPFQEVMPT
jgi:hypothetical protein